MIKYFIEYQPDLNLKDFLKMNVTNETKMYIVS